jgi:NAD(P)-dependent dehydrogenase (short-subunit alcohol dehydrogenase family)
MFNNQIVVITGGAGLIGTEIVLAFAEKNATIIIADIAEDAATNLADRLGGINSNIHIKKMDISKSESIQNCFKTIVADFGKIDVWINNAYPRTNDWGTKIDKISHESWRQNIDMHLNGYCLCCRDAAEIMKKRGMGSIINMASIYGIVAPDFSIYEGTEMTLPAAYSAIKAGIIHFTKYCAAYYGPFGIRINCISPGGIFDKQPERFVEKYSKRTPLRRMGNPKDIANAAIFLASDAAGYITGHNLVVDGGWSIV